jgi:hypothetical protein
LTTSTPGSKNSNGIPWVRFGKDDRKIVVLNVFCKHSRVRQYLKEGRALRIETVINCPRGLIHRIEHTNRYVLTPDGTRFAVFYTKLHNRLLRPLMAADQDPAPPGHHPSYSGPCMPSTSTSMTTSTAPAS